MRIGLYRPKIRAARNPWRESATRITDGGPAAQYFAGSAVVDEMRPQVREFETLCPPVRVAGNGDRAAGRQEAREEEVAGEAPLGSVGRTAYPRIDCDGVVVMDVPFDVVIGLVQSRDHDLVSAGPLTLPAGEFDVELLLTYDPESLRMEKAGQFVPCMSLRQTRIRAPQ